MDFFNDKDEDARQVRQLYERIHRLKPFDRAIVLLWLEGMPYDEIASIVGIMVKNVSVRLYRIKDIYQILLQESPLHGQHPARGQEAGPAPEETLQLVVEVDGNTLPGDIRSMDSARYVPKLRRSAPKDNARLHGLRTHRGPHRRPVAELESATHRQRDTPADRGTGGGVIPL